MGFLSILDFITFRVFIFFTQYQFSHIHISVATKTTSNDVFLINNVSVLEFTQSFMVFIMQMFLLQEICV